MDRSGACRTVVQSDGMESDPDSRPTYEPMPGSRMARTPEERAEAFAGFPERILELREQRSSRTLSDAEQDELRLLEEILVRSAPTFCPRTEVSMPNIPPGRGVRPEAQSKREIE